MLKALFCPQQVGTRVTTCENRLAQGARRRGPRALGGQESQEEPGEAPLRTQTRQGRPSGPGTAGRRDPGGASGHPLLSVDPTAAPGLVSSLRPAPQQRRADDERP